MAIDARYSVLAGLLAPGGDDRVHALLKNLGFHLWHPAMERRGEDDRLLLLDGIEEFREHLGGELTVTLLAAPGRGEEVNHLDRDRIRQAMSWLRRRETGS